MKVNKKGISLTLHVDLLQWISEEAKKEHISRSEVMAMAIEKLREAKIRDELKESYLRMREDPETLELADAGLEDFLHMIDRHDSTR